MSIAAKSIVIVDDERPYLDLLAAMVRDQFENPIATFSRPMDALEALPQIDAGIVLSDYFMPRLTGLELIVRARALLPELPFVIISGHGVHLSEEDFSHLPELRAVIAKPVSLRHLTQTVSTHWPGAARRRCFVTESHGACTDSLGANP